RLRDEVQVDDAVVRREQAEGRVAVVEGRLSLPELCRREPLDANARLFRAVLESRDGRLLWRDIQRPGDVEPPARVRDFVEELSASDGQPAELGERLRVAEDGGVTAGGVCAQQRL